MDKWSSNILKYLSHGQATKKYIKEPEIEEQGILVKIKPFSEAQVQSVYTVMLFVF